MSGKESEVRIVIAIMSRVCLVFTCLLFFTAVARGQNVSEKFCKQIKTSVVRRLNPTRMSRQEVYDHECVFEFTLAGDVDVSLTVEKHNTEEASHKSLDRFLDLVALGEGLEGKKDLRFDKLDTGKSWDEVYFLRATTTNSGIVSLRRGKFAVTILSLKDELLIRIEQLLRDHPNFKNQSVFRRNLGRTLSWRTLWNRGDTKRLIRL